MKSSLLAAGLLATASLQCANIMKSSSGSMQQTQMYSDLPANPITPPVPMAKNGVGLAFSADFIYWKSFVSGLEFAASGVHDNGTFIGPFQDVAKGHIQGPKFTFEPGFKIGLDWLTGLDGWDLNFQYTWLNNQNSQTSIGAHDATGLSASYPIVFSTGNWFDPDLYSASAKWEQSFNILDAKLGRNFFISRTLSLRPHVGMKFGWIDGKTEMNFQTIVSEGMFMDPQILAKAMQNMWGLGIRTGLDSMWHFTKYLGIYSEFALTGLWSFFYTKETQTQNVASYSIVTLNNSEKIQKIVNVLELGLGLRYVNWFKQERYKFLIQAGWEEQLWLEFNNYPAVTYALPGSMSIQGLTFKTALSF